MVIPFARGSGSWTCALPLAARRHCWQSLWPYALAAERKGPRPRTPPRVLGLDGPILGASWQWMPGTARSDQWGNGDFGRHAWVTSTAGRSTNIHTLSAQVNWWHRNVGDGARLPQFPASSRSSRNLRALCKVPDRQPRKTSLSPYACSWPRLERLKFNLTRLLPCDNQPTVHHHARNHLNHAGNPSHPDAHPGGNPPPALWRRGCVTVACADGRRLRVDTFGTPLPPERRSRQPGSRTSRRSTYPTATTTPGPDGGDGECAQGGVFDRVLVDAPCSGLGRVQLGVPGSYSHWDGELRGVHGRRQRELLLRGAELLAAPDGASGGRGGGRLVYSTCTLDPAENEQVGVGGGWEAGVSFVVAHRRVAGSGYYGRAQGCDGIMMLSLQHILRYTTGTPTSANEAFCN